MVNALFGGFRQNRCRPSTSIAWIANPRNYLITISNMRKLAVRDFTFVKDDVFLSRQQQFIIIDALRKEL
jgi:hypothetical protein